MGRRCCLALFVASLIVAGCDNAKPDSRPADTSTDANPVRRYSEKKPDEGHLDGEVRAGLGPLPYLEFSLKIKGLDVLAAKVIDWLRGRFEYAWRGEALELKLTEQQLEALKKEGKASGKLEDGREYVIEKK